MKARQLKILDIVNSHRRIPVSQLAELTGVSGVTIRQDLNQLEEEGYLKRVHGAAVAVTSDDIDTRLEVRHEVKQALAHRAAELVGPQEAVLIEGGSANTLLAKILADRGDVTIITASSYIAHHIRNTSANIILLGGVFQHQGESLVGPLTKLCLDHLHFSTAFLGIDGFDAHSGFTSRDMMRADIANHIINRCKRNIVITDSSKFGKIHAAKIASKISDIAILITDRGAPEHAMKLIHESGVEVVYV